MKYKLIYIISIFCIMLTSSFAHKIKFTAIEKEFIKNNPTVKVGAETDWPPFDFVENNKYQGVAKEYLDLISHKSGLTFNYEIDTWSNLVEKTKNKEIDMLPCLSKTPEREKFLLYSKKYIDIRDYVIAKKDNEIINSMEDISNKTIAVIKGYVQEEIFKTQYPSVKIYYVETFIEALDAVITNKADFLVANIAILNYYKRKNNLIDIEAKFHFASQGNQLYMATNRDNRVLQSIINKSLESVTLEEKEAIYTKWIDQDSSKVAISNKLNLTQVEMDFIKHHKEITIANELDWVPLDFNEDNIPKGYVIDYVKLIFQKLGLNPIFVAKEWKYLLEDFKEKKIDILPVVSYHKSREKNLLFTDSYYFQNLSIMTKSSVNDIINMDDLKNKKLGMVKNWNITYTLKKEYPEINVIEFDALEDIFDGIQNNFIDATIQNSILAKYYINKNYYGILKSDVDVTINGFDERLFMGIQKDLPMLQRVIDKAINSITKEELDLLEKKWIRTVTSVEFTKEEKEFIKNTIVVASTGNSWAPFSFLEDGQLRGLGVDLWKYIVDKAKLQNTITTHKSFVEILNLFKAKESDIVLATTKTKDKENYGIFTNTYLTAPIGIATQLDKHYIKDAKQLLGKTVAVGENYSSHQLLKEKYPKMKFLFVQNAKEGLLKVSQNEAYAYVDMMPVLTYNIQKHNFTNLKVAGQTGLDFNLNFMIRPDYPLLKSIIDKTIRSMSYDEKQDITNKWIKTEYEKSFDYSLFWKIIVGFLIVLLYVLYKNRQLKAYQLKLEKAQKTTEVSLENFKTLMNQNIAGIVIIQENEIVYINDEVLNILEYDNKSMLLNQDIEILLTLVNDDENQSFETVAKKLDGETIPILLRKNCIKFENKDSALLSIIDLSDIKNKEKIIIQQSKMASLGEMIGNIAHQWRQPLSYISMAASGMKVEKEFNTLSDEKFIKTMDGIVDTTMFLSQTIDDFRDYIMDTKIKKEFYINSCIERVLSLMQGAFNNSFIKVDTQIDNIQIIGYENEFNQVLLNLLSNSKDALKEIPQEKRYISIQAFKNDTSLVVEVIDTGGGIKDEIIQKVFEPYFTTKHKSQGTGLGLYMTHNIVKNSMHGDIKIENCIFKTLNSTKVTVTLPF